MNQTTGVITRLRLVIIVLIVALIAAIAYSLANQQPADTIPDLATFTVKIDDVEKIVSSNGNVVSKDSRSVYFPAGKVLNVAKSVGNTVNKNGLLGKVEVTTAFGTEVQDIRSPIKGRVTVVNVKKDDSIFSATQPSVIVADQSGYWVEASVNENDIIDVKKNQTVEIVFPAISVDDKYEGKVRSIDPAASVTAGAVEYKVIVNIVEVPQELKLGMSADVEILAALREDVLAVPENFLVEKNDKYFVKKLVWNNLEKTEYTIQEIPVEVGLITDELVEIEDGLEIGETIVDPSFTDAGTRQLSIFGN